MHGHDRLTVKLGYFLADNFCARYYLLLRFERTEIVKLLLEKGADPMIPSNSLLTPLHSAARRGFLDICSLLLKDPRVEPTVGLGSGGVQPFHLACISGNRELCELFLRNGADITSNSRTKYTPLHVASFQGHEEVCHLLIETGNCVVLRKRNVIVRGNVRSLVQRSRVFLC